MSQSTSVPISAYGNFDLVRRIKLSFTDVEISKWRSRVTGLSVVHVDYSGSYTVLIRNFLMTYFLHVLFSSYCRIR